MSASETQVLQTLRQLHQGNKGQREGEAGMSPLDQLIGQPETEEQLRKLVVLFSEVKSSAQKWRLKFIKHSFYPTHRGSLLFFCAAADFLFEQINRTLRFEYPFFPTHPPRSLRHFQQQCSISEKGFAKNSNFQATFSHIPASLLIWAWIPKFGTSPVVTRTRCSTYDVRIDSFHAISAKSISLLLRTKPGVCTCACIVCNK